MGVWMAPRDADSLTQLHASGGKLQSLSWVVSGPHVMLVVPRSAAGTPLSVADAPGGPYVMWAGTPYEHILMPVR